VGVDAVRCILVAWGCLLPSASCIVSTWDWPRLLANRNSSLRKIEILGVGSTHFLVKYVPCTLRENCVVRPAPSSLKHNQKEMKTDCLFLTKHVEEQRFGDCVAFVVFPSVRCGVWWAVCGVPCGVWSVVCCVLCVVCGVQCVVCSAWCVVWCVVCYVWCVVCGAWCVLCVVCAALHAHLICQYFACVWTNMRHSSGKNHRTNWWPQQSLSNSSVRLRNRRCMSAADFHSQSPCAFLVSSAQATRSVDLNVVVTYKSQNSLLCNFY
jgi:hypothetical protein